MLEFNESGIYRDGVLVSDKMIGKGKNQGGHIIIDGTDEEGNYRLVDVNEK